MQSSPFKLINVAERARLAALAAHGAQAWTRRWLPAAPLPMPLCEDAWVPERSDTAATIDSGWRCYSAAGSALAYVQVSPALREAFAEAAFGLGVNRMEATGAGPSQLLPDLFDIALRELVAGFASAGAVDARMSDESGATPVGRAVDLTAFDAAPEASVLRRGAGTLRVSWPLGRTRARMLWCADLVRALLGPPPAATTTGLPLTPVTQALEERRLALRAWAGSVEISLGEVHTLAPGDVVRLDAGLHEPFQLTLCGADVPVRGFLGSMAGRRALKLAPNTSTLESTS